MINAENFVNIHLSLKVFKHSSNLCKILLFWVLNLMFEFFIKFTHQISAVIDYSFSIIIHILMIKKNSNCLLSFSMLLCFSWCKRSYICLRFHKLIICSVIRTGSFMPLLTITMTTSLLRVPPDLSPRTGSPTISLTFCIISAALTLIFDPATERRDLKTFLTLIWIKREVSERGRFRGKSLLLVRHCWSRCDHGF